jgi:glutamyl-tRNA synthetase
MSSEKINGGVRFAPSPTGRFHVGNLRTAWIANAFAETHKLPLVIRMEDIDKPRVQDGARELQLADMHAIGVRESRIYDQTQNHRHHFDLFFRAVQEGIVYACDCSRKEVQHELANLASAPHSSPAVYSGNCRKRDFAKSAAPKSQASIAWRFKMPNESGHEDFVVARTSPSSINELTEQEFVPAYHWACAIDDYFGNYRLLIRAWDLEDSARLQRAIQYWLSQATQTDFPAIFHTALVVRNDGHRLEKRTKGVTLPELATLGISASELQRKFALSFNSGHLTQLPAIGAINGETEKALSLESLGLPEAK